MQAVDQVHVGMPGPAEHHPRARGQPLRGMRREVVRPEVGLGLDDATDPRRAIDHVHQVHAQQFAGHRGRGAIVEGAGEHGRFAVVEAAI